MVPLPVLDVLEIHLIRELRHAACDDGERASNV